MSSHLKRNSVFYFLIVILSLTAVFFYFYGEYRLKKMHDWVEDQRQEVNFYAGRAIDSASVTPLRLTAQSLSWAIRTELLNENKKEIERYLRELSREPAIQMAVLCDTALIITAAAHIEQFGKPFVEYHDAKHLTVTDISIVPATNAQGFFLVAPIMGLNTRYGTLFIHYTPVATEVFKALPKWDNGEF